MKKHFLIAAALIVSICSCDLSKERPAQKKGNGGNGSLISGPGVGYKSAPAEKSTGNTEPSNKRKHFFLHPSIPSIGATFDTVKFFEGPYYPPNKEQRQYRVSFDRRSRYINWEISLFHKPPGQAVSYRIDSEWYSGGKLFYRYALKVTIEADWENSYFSHSYSMGPWVQGIYRVDLSIGGQKIASEYFDVYNADCSGDIAFTGADKVDALRRQAESSRGNDADYEDALYDLGTALHNRGGQCFLNGHLDAAYQDFSEAIQLDSNFRMAYYHRSQVLLDMKLYKEALADLNTALRDKENDEFYATRARVQFHLENDSAALSDLNRAIDLNSKDPRFYHDRGIVLYYLMQDQDALRDLKQAASMYQSKNENEKYRRVSTDIDILEGRTQGYLRIYDTGRMFTVAEFE